MNRDPTLSKYGLDDMKRMKEMRDKGWSYETIQSRFKRITSRKELIR